MYYRLGLGLLGTVAPCVLYGRNMERLESTPGTFRNHCLIYSGLCIIGALLRLPCLASCFSCYSRTAIRRKFKLEASCFISFFHPNHLLGSDHVHICLISAFKCPAARMLSNWHLQICSLSGSIKLSVKLYYMLAIQNTYQHETY